MYKCYGEFCYPLKVLYSLNILCIFFIKAYSFFIVSYLLYNLKILNKEYITNLLKILNSKVVV
ncbi:hypothetical protein C2G38_592868 [Gigaspora rosea]|uniref:Uncharacterized protein n=1 Tax=Gigaspora rosea TaxID=44941 RepID=A0A397UDN1_9GLOM|nr:hypothetical protein C2G38_592868 [Gigaspora rosea]